MEDTTLGVLYETFLSQVLTKGRELSDKAFEQSKDPSKVIGRLAGFEACEGLGVRDLSTLLTSITPHLVEAREEARLSENGDNYRKLQCFETEVTWVCKVVSAQLVADGFAPIIDPDQKSRDIAIEIMGTKPLLKVKNPLSGGYPNI